MFLLLANKGTLLWTHCYQHKCFPVCPRAQHLLRTQILCPGHKIKVSDFVQKHFVSAENVSQFTCARKHHEQQCVRNNVSSFASTFMLTRLHLHGKGREVCIKARSTPASIAFLARVIYNEKKSCGLHKLWLKQVANWTI